MYNKLLSTNLFGEAIYPDKSSDDLAFVAFNNWADNEVFKLSNGTIFKEDNKFCRTIKCDIAGDDPYWNGYIIGFLYDDGKFNGKYHPVAHSLAKPENMSGKYLQSKTGITLFGDYYQGNEYKGRFILNFGKLQFKRSESKPRKIINRKSPASLNSAIFTKDLFSILTSRSIKTKKHFNSSEYDHYSHIMRLKLKPESSDVIITAASIAYSWMPTMLHLHIGVKFTMKELMQSILFLGKINSYKSFLKYNNEIIESLLIVTECINHSVVGASKTLHILYPQHIPILDSNALKGWNIFFKKYYKKFPDLKLNKTVPANIPNQVVLYMSYWEFLLIWSENIKITNLRRIEEPFYWLGKSKI